MSEEALFPPAVFTVWRIGLVVTLVVFVPLAVYWLHQLWRAARFIQIYAREALTAAGGIAGNTVHIPALETTIRTATEILEAAGQVEKKTGAVADALAARARGAGPR